MLVRQFKLSIVGAVAALAAFSTAPALALVEPEIPAYQEAVATLRAEFPLPGAELLVEAAEQAGRLGAALAMAPLAELMKELELRRGLRFKYFTPWHVKDKESLGRFIKRELAKEYSPEKAAGEEAMLKVLGLVSSDFRIVPFMEELLTDAVAGVYDPTADQFFLVDMEAGRGLGERLQNRASTALLGDMNSVVIIHELNHALGGQHFPFKTTLEELSRHATLDEQLAAMALVEGDATFVMIDHQEGGPAHTAGDQTVIANTDLLTDILVRFPIPLPGMGKFTEAPLFFKKSLIFPYYSGAEFVSYLRHFGSGWQHINAAYRELPQTTRSIYHPGDYLYLSRPPRHPDFGFLPSSLGPWRKAIDQTGGEFLVRVVLEQHGVEGHVEAATGWDGDRLRVYRHVESGALALYWCIRWQNEAEAEEFFETAGDSLPFRMERSGSLTELSTGLSDAERVALREAVRP